MLDAWRESPLYSERERAALELCEAVTLVADTHVPDDVWAAAAGQFDQDELTQLVFAITAINAWNRLVISARTEPGHYRPPVRKRPERSGEGPPRRQLARGTVRPRRRADGDCVAACGRVAADVRRRACRVGA